MMTTSKEVARRWRWRSRQAMRLEEYILIAVNFQVNSRHYPETDGEFRESIL